MCIQLYCLRQAHLSYIDLGTDICHHFEQTSDSGAKMNLLQKYLFVALDNFRSIKHNEGSEMVINNRLEAWLAFMCMDDPDDILRIIER